MKLDHAKPKRRKPWAGVFEKVRILFRPRVVTIEPEQAGSKYVLRYGPLPEHVVRAYPTIGQAIASGRKLSEKFGSGLEVIARNGEKITNPCQDEMYLVMVGSQAFLDRPLSEAMLRFKVEFK